MLAMDSRQSQGTELGDKLDCESDGHSNRCHRINGRTRRAIVRSKFCR